MIQWTLIEVELTLLCERQNQESATTFVLLTLLCATGIKPSAFALLQRRCLQINKWDALILARPPMHNLFMVEQWNHFMNCTTEHARLVLSFQRRLSTSVAC